MLVRDYGALQMAQSDKANYPAHKQVKRAKKKKKKPKRRKTTAVFVYPKFFGNA